MDHLPIFVRLARQPCLVVGGGAVAERKVALLRRAGAWVTVVAPRLNDRLAALRERNDISHIPEFFQPLQLQGMRLVIAATGDGDINNAIAQAADNAGLLCNVVDDNRASSFILPAIVDRAPVTIAVGTGGKAPVLAQRLKSQIEARLPARIGELATQAGRWREQVKKRFATLDQRRRFWQRLFDGPVAEHILANRSRKAEQLIRRELIGSAGSREQAAGEAFIVGAGPGDPGLVTLRAQQLISLADVVLYDRLVAAPVLDFARKEADLIDVGKGMGDPKDRQARINTLLVDLVRQGKRVCRLKGGDPFIFGRGGEEALALRKAGLPFQIVPGISAALGCAAYAGIPLTMRGVSGSVTFATARLDGNRSADWNALARSGQTLALYMSAGALDSSAVQLISHGLPGNTPAAVVENGTTERQRVLHSTLSQVARDASAAGIEAPAMFFVGPSVALAGQLEWFDSTAEEQLAASDTSVAVSPQFDASAVIPRRRAFRNGGGR